MDYSSVPAHWQWFPESRYGMFIHWGPYSIYGRGEQVLFREHLDQKEYSDAACAWNPVNYDAREWAQIAKSGGFKYAVLTTRHHDGYCLWDSAYTDYSSAKQAAGRDLVGEYVEAFREAGLRVGLYYSLADWRIPAYWEGAENDPEGWATFRQYVHNQVRELLTNYGKIDVIWFDGAWPASALEWGGPELVDMIRSLQPDILINNRLGRLPEETSEAEHADGGAGPGAGKKLGDFGTPEHQIVAEDRLWESCQVSTWRLWGYSIGERWRSADFLLDMLIEATGKGGNLLMNVGPTADGRIPPEFAERMTAIGDWLKVHGELIHGADDWDVFEFVTRGHQIVRGNTLYLVIRFWDRRPTMRLAGLATPVRAATLLTTGQTIEFEQSGDELVLKGLPEDQPTPLFPVIKLECEDKPQPCAWAKDRLWGGDPRRMTEWARARGTSVYTDGKEREQD